jgi:hypothetical protein
MIPSPSFAGTSDRPRRHKGMSPASLTRSAIRVVRTSDAVDGAQVTSSSDRMLFLLGAAIIGGTVADLVYSGISEQRQPIEWLPWYAVPFVALMSVLAVRERRPRLRVAWIAGAGYLAITALAGNLTWAYLVASAMLLVMGASFIGATARTAGPDRAWWGATVLGLAAAARVAARYFAFLYSPRGGLP